jgi:hypothetical protein
VQVNSAEINKRRAKLTSHVTRHKSRARTSKRVKSVQLRLLPPLLLLLPHPLGQRLHVREKMAG